MTDVVIKAENLGKHYTIGHQAADGRYVALRDVLVNNARSLWRGTQTWRAARSNPGPKRSCARCKGRVGCNRRRWMLCSRRTGPVKRIGRACGHSWPWGQWYNGYRLVSDNGQWRNRMGTVD